MTDRPDPVEPAEQAVRDEKVEVAATAAPPESGEQSAQVKGEKPRRRVRRRAERPGTNPSADDAPDVVPPRAEPKPGETQHDRWLREQRPPHWE